VTPEIASSPGSGARGYLGVQIQSITPEIASAMGLKEPKGFLVINVGAGGPAAKAGFEQGDVVTAIDGKSVEDSSDLVRHLESAIAGTSSDFTIDRQGQSMTVKVMIEVRPEEKLASNATATPSGSTPPYSIQPSSPTVSTNAAVKPSFDCGISLTDIEKIICGNSELSSLDAQVTSFYRTARMAATYPKVILEEQRKWLLDRNACGTLSCLVASYRARRDYLGQWVKPNP
jgi:uncharacterized protein YecT (DUF1311 family)